MANATISDSTAAGGPIVSATSVPSGSRHQFSTAKLQTRLKTISEELAHSAAIVDLVQRVESTDGLQSACFTIAARLREYLRCDRVVVGTHRHGRRSIQVMSVSGSAEIDQHADETRRIRAALDECLMRKEVSAWPPLPVREGPADPSAECAPGKTKTSQMGDWQLLAHRQLARRDSCVMTVPLKSPDGKPLGALMIVGRREMAAVPQIANFARALSEPLGAALALMQRAEGSRLRRLMRILLAGGHTRTRWIVVAMLLVVMGIMLIPLPYKVACRSLTEPLERRFSVAPYEGLLESTLAEPGDLVESGQLLARMDGREIRWELAGVTADAARAARTRDTHMAHHKTSDALLAGLEMKRLECRSRLLRYREQNLDITSPITGVVLTGSLDRRENYPVTRGHVLYEIAPPDSLRVELSVPARDITRVHDGLCVEMTFAGLGGEVLEGHLNRTRPRSEIRDGQNVFVAEVVIDNAERRLRPGMEGTAKIVTNRRTIGWILFHRAGEKLLTLWPW